MNSPEIEKSASANTEVFWGEIAPCEHMVQIYEDDAVFLDSLEGYVVGGILAGDSVIVIALPDHLNSLSVRLSQRGIDLAGAIAKDQYLTFDAEATVAKFMADGWPDETLFKELIASILQRAKAGGRRVRAFGEMVAVLWAQGNSGATVRLEHLWHALCHEQSFSLFCAYPKSGFTRDASASIKEICDTHSKVIS